MKKWYNLKRRGLFLFIFAIIPLINSAQSFQKQRSVMGVAGKSVSFESNGVKVDYIYSIGQRGIVGTKIAGKQALLQGFIQPTFKYAVIQKNDLAEINVRTLPNSNIYMISLNNIQQGITSMELYSITGAKLLSKRFENNGEFCVDLSAYKPGFYLLSINTNNQRIGTKLVKTN
jgi:hypothetical protein